MKQKLHKVMMAYYLAILVAGMTQLVRADDKPAAPAPAAPTASAPAPAPSGDKESSKEKDDDDDDNEQGEHEG
jgi:ribosomal protein L12E/L44/L45/RPP1/RPP2